MKTIETLSSPFKHLVMTIGELPTTFVESMSYYEALAWLVNYMEKTLLPAVNENAEATKELQEAFVLLKEYVENYFDDLNIQEEINNKLDAMAESGQLAEIINQEIFDDLNDTINAVKDDTDANTETLETLTTDYYVKVHYPTTDGLSGSRHALKFKDFTAVIDLGIKDYINGFIGYLVSHEMTKINYVVITHFDIDHVAGDINGFRSFIENVNLDFTDCQFIFPHTPDWTRMSGVDGQKARFEAIRDYLLGNNYTIIYPEEGEIIEIDGGNKFEFHNCSDEMFSNYYAIETTPGITNYNNFSLVTKLIGREHSFLFPGDIEDAAESNVSEVLGGYDVIAIPHHGATPTADPDFLKNMPAIIGVSMDVADPLYQNPLINQFADYNRVLFSSNVSGNVVIDGGSLGYLSDNGALYPKYANVILTTDDLNDYTSTGVYHYRGTSGAPSNSIPGYSNQFRLEVIESTSISCEQILIGTRTINDIWFRKITSGTPTEWKCLTNSVFNGGLSSNDTLGSDYTRLSVGTIYETFTNILSNDSGIKANVKVNGIKLNARVTVNGCNEGDRITVRIVKNNTDICHYDCYYGGNQTSFNLDCITSANANDVFNVEVRNVTASRGSIVNDAAYSAFSAVVL